MTTSRLSLAKPLLIYHSLLAVNKDTNRTLEPLEGVDDHASGGRLLHDSDVLFTITQERRGRVRSSVVMTSLRKGDRDDTMQEVQKASISGSPLQLAHEGTVVR